MKIAISKTTHAETCNRCEQRTFTVYEDRNELIKIGPYTLLHDALSMLELYQRYWEVEACLHKSPDRETYIRLYETREKLHDQIQLLISLSNAN